MVMLSKRTQKRFRASRIRSRRGEELIAVYLDGELKFTFDTVAEARTWALRHGMDIDEGLV